MGRVGVGLFRARSRDDVPVLELRGARTRSPTRARRGRRRGAVRHGAGGHGRSHRGGPELPTSRRRRGPRRLRLLRGAGLHPRAAPRGHERGDRPDVHGAPSGHGPRRARQYTAGRTDARALPRRTERPGDRAPAAGTNPPRRRRGPAPRRGSDGHRRCARVRARRRSPLQLAAQRDAPDASAVERPLRRDGDRRRLRLQPLARPGDHPLAGRRHLRRRGNLRLPSRRPERRNVVGGLPAERTGAGALRRGVRGGPRRDRAARPRHRDDARGDRLAGRRRGDPSRVAHEPRREIPRDRGDIVRRGRARHTGRRCRASGVLQPVRADGVRPRARHPARHPSPAVARRGPALAGARCPCGRRHHPSASVGNRSHEVPGAGPRDPHARRRPRRRAAVQHGGRRARPDRQSPTLRAARPRQYRARGVLDARRTVARRGARPRRQVS